ncbi:MAG: hypothetical protein HZB14_03955 [Actinobacteria bacterium]|nr:hypothetical protein [Actinomycetota bacterium]
MLQIRNNRLAAVAVSIALGLSAGLASGPAVAQPPVSDSPVVQISCKKATIGGKRKCIAAGQYCARRYEKDYNKYGYTCSKKDRNGRYHLKKL